MRVRCVYVYIGDCEQNGAEPNEKRNSGERNGEKRELTAAGAQHVYWRISQS